MYGGVKIMNTRSPESPLVQKAQEMCVAITQQEDFPAIKGAVDAFMGDELLKFKFSQVNELGQILQMKQQQGMELKPEEVTQFEALREEVLGNPVAQGFLQAQEQLQELQQMLSRFVDRTFELGRQPQLDEIHDGSCGNCGCHG